MKSDADPTLLRALPAELRELLHAELAAGNRILECQAGLYAPDAVLVLLANAFQHRAEPPEGVVYRAVNDPHWWKAEYFHVGTRHCIACRF